MYYQEKHGWSEKTLYSIDWDAYKGARNQYKYNDIAFTTKLCCRWLATCYHKHKLNPLESDKCIACDEVETQDHLFRCRSRSKWRDDFITGLDKMLDKYQTETSVRIAIITGLKDWLHYRPNSCSWDPQKDIRWEQFFTGFISAEWGYKQQEHYDQIRERKLTSVTWGMKLIQCMWQHAKKAWKLRNDLVHGKEDPNSDAAKRFRADLEIKVRNLYSYSDKLYEGDRDLLSMPLEERLQAKTSVLDKWYEDTYQIMQICIRDYVNRTKEGTHDIRRFFKLKPPETTTAANNTEGA